MKTKIAIDNDLFRNTMINSPRHRVIFTEGVFNLDPTDVAKIVGLVRADNVFTNDNDPNGEHDFGSVVYNDVKYFWKMDYYDKNFEFGADPTEGQVSRVLTIMRADEY